MKAILFLAAAGAAVAQNLSGEPACATSCLSSAITAAGCAPTDVACQCGPSIGAIGGLAAPCLLKACTDSNDLISAQSAGAALCSQFSAGLTAPSTTATTTTTAPTVTSAATTTTSTSTSGSGSGSSSPLSSHSGSGTSSSSPSAQSTNAAATPVALGAGMLAAFMGAVAAL